VAKDNTVAIGNRHWQIEKNAFFRHTLGRMYGDGPRAPGCDDLNSLRTHTWWGTMTRKEKG